MTSLVKENDDSGQEQSRQSDDQERVAVRDCGQDQSGAECILRYQSGVEYLLGDVIEVAVALALVAIVPTFLPGLAYDLGVSIFHTCWVYAVIVFFLGAWWGESRFGVNVGKALSGSLLLSGVVLFLSLMAFVNEFENVEVWVSEVSVAGDTASLKNNLSIYVTVRERDLEARGRRIHFEKKTTD